MIQFHQAHFWGMRFAETRTAYGLLLPARTRQEVLRLSERLSLVERQIEQVEAKRDKEGVDRPGTPLKLLPSDRCEYKVEAPVPDVAGSAQTHQQVVAIKRVPGVSIRQIGEVDL